MRKKLLLAILFSLGIWGYLLLGAGASKHAPAASAASTAAAHPVNPEEGIAAYFSPSGGCTDAVIAEIGKATQSIDVQSYLLTSTPIAQSFKEAHARGVRVRIVLDKGERTDRASSANYLLAQHVPVYIDDHHKTAHNKVILIDGKTLITGSFNLTKSAEDENAENLLVIHDRPKLMAAYQANFDRHLDHSIPYALPAK